MGRGRGFFFHFCFVPTQHLPFKFPMGSQYVLGSQCVPQVCFQVVFGVESELSIVHFPLGQLTFHASFVFYFF